MQNDTLQSLLTGKKMQHHLSQDGWQIPAECRQCRWIRLCRGGCKRDRNATDTAQRSYYCKALQKFLPMRNRACARWSAPFKCTAEKETDSIGQEK
ncbi:MAG: SPASM domain-containing protein [Subdoligranulum sp.]